MARVLNEEEIKMMINMGALGYESSKIAILMDMDVSEVETGLKDPENTLYKAYKKGEYLSEYKIDLKLLEMAQSGDIKAMERIEQKKQTREYQESQKREKKRE